MDVPFGEEGRYFMLKVGKKSDERLVKGFGGTITDKRGREYMKLQKSYCWLRRLQFSVGGGHCNDSYKFSTHEAYWRPTLSSIRVQE